MGVLGEPCDPKWWFRQSTVNRAMLNPDGPCCDIVSDRLSAGWRPAIPPKLTYSRAKRISANANHSQFRCNVEQMIGSAQGPTMNMHARFGRPWDQHCSYSLNVSQAPPNWDIPYSVCIGTTFELLHRLQPVDGRQISARSIQTLHADH